MAAGGGSYSGGEYSGGALSVDLPLFEFLGRGILFVIGFEYI